MADIDLETITPSALDATDEIVVRRGTTGAFSVELAPADVLVPLALHDYWAHMQVGGANASLIYGPFVSAAVSSGTIVTTIPASALKGFNAGGAFLRSSTTANSGYRFTTSNAGDYFGVISKKARAVWQPLTSHVGVTMRCGFHDATTVTAPVDGAFFECSAGVVTAKTRSNSTETAAGSSYTLTLGNVYTFDVEVNAAGNEARFRVWEDQNETAVYDVTITTNIPNTSARAFGAGLICTESSTTASDLGVLVSLSVGTIAGYRRATGRAA